MNRTVTDVPASRADLSGPEREGGSAALRGGRYAFLAWVENARRVGEGRSVQGRQSGGERASSPPRPVTGPEPGGHEQTTEGQLAGWPRVGPALASRCGRGSGGPRVAAARAAGQGVQCHYFLVILMQGIHKEGITRGRETNNTHAHTHTPGRSRASRAPKARGHGIQMARRWRPVNMACMGEKVVPSLPFE